MRVRRVVSWLLAVVALAILAPRGVAEEVAVPSVLFRDVRIFDGVHADLSAGDDLVVGNTIAKVVAGGGIEAPDGVTIVEGGGRILSPGFIDIHAHPAAGLNAAAAVEPVA